MASQTILNCSNEHLIGHVAQRAAAWAIHADPAWSYSSGKSGGSLTSAASDVYRTQTTADIARTVDSAAELCYPDAYLALWVTFPLLAEWMAQPLRNWRYLSGGCWGKTGRTGMGYHFRGDSELLLLYRKSACHPRPHNGSKTNLWLADRGDHSEKPQEALRPLAEMLAPKDGLIIDLWAGETASMARACQHTGRSYLGAELDPERHATALNRLAGDSAEQARQRNQQRLFG